LRSEAKRQLHKEIEVMKGVHDLLPVVIIDEAHLLDREMLEEIRFLLNFKMDSQSPMSLILAGQTELWAKLKLQSYAAIRQRIDLQCGIGHMDRHQTDEYINTHLDYAGCNKNIFSEAAVDDIFRYSSGIPRLINKACTSSLIYGAQNRKSIIDDRMVGLVIECELSCWGGVSMSLAELQTYVDAASGDSEIGVVVRSIETGDEIALTFDVVADISEYGELMISIVV